MPFPPFSRLLLCASSSFLAFAFSVSPPPPCLNCFCCSSAAANCLARTSAFSSSVNGVRAADGDEALSLQQAPHTAPIRTQRTRVRPSGRSSLLNGMDVLIQVTLLKRLSSASNIAFYYRLCSSEGFRGRFLLLLPSLVWATTRRAGERTCLQRQMPITL